MSQIQRALRACADTKVTPLTPHWADDARRLMRQAADALDAAEEVMSEHRAQAPAEGYDDSTLQQAEAWAAVFAVLSEVSPGWHKNAKNGMDAAVATIRGLANVQPKGMVEVPAGIARSDAEFWLRKRGELLSALAAHGLTMVTTVNGVQLMRLGKIEAQSATQAPAPGADDMLEPLIYAAIMHNGKPKTVADFERAAAAVADMLKRRTQAPAVAHGWQPIETAPQDGTTVLTFRTLNGEPQIVDARYFEATGCWGQRSWRYPDRMGPTHWMPLPAAPESNVPVQNKEGA